MKILRILMLTLMTSAMIMNVVYAEKKVKKGKKSGLKVERKNFNNSQRGKRKDHFGNQKSENKDLKSSLKDASLTQKAAALAENRTTQYAENQQFREEHRERRNSFIDSMVQKGYLKSDRSSKIKENLSIRWDNGDARRDNYVEKMTSTLKTLSLNNEITKAQHVYLVQDIYNLFSYKQHV